MAVEKKLSKREQKAEAFKKRAKKPQFTDEMAVPESDEILPTVTVAEPVASAPVKRKAEAISVPVEGESTEPHKKKNRRSKKSSNMDGSRYIIFVGNLPYATTKEELEKHFENVEGIKSTRLLTDKATGKPKGFAFMEFENSKDLNKALAFHHTFFKKRQINVELTAGGGGSKSETRKEKLKVKNERLTEERAKKHEEIKGKAAPESSYKIDIPQ
ncbi:uncharacterized protein EV154DRAFT_455689 [Mucor mucedo]|uniref:uncharacterized protein n=1 Tax=Mucor mucedo TaxID=29922 RepID=UPI00221EA28E|nr:uncharacterized protein EV154DRAFT_455689 [Mucor mucedo]KAI7896527.1 hypothetical protein EV154DRAFT_455689 [Mucor mucedo]